MLPGVLGRWGRLGRAFAVALVAVPGASLAGPPVLKELRVVEVRGGRAAILRLSRPVEPAVVPVRGADGTLLRLHLDLPAGTTVAPGVARVVPGAPPLSRVRLGVAGGGRSRLVVDVVPDATFVVRRAPDRRTLSIAVGPPREASAVRAAGAPPRRAAGPAPAAGASVPLVPRARRPRIVLDAGHGGDDPGAMGYVVEKHVTLDIVRRLARRLREDLGAEVVLTRSSDATVPLGERTAIANQAGADVFVSVHANAHPRGNRKGIETYVLDNTDDHATLRLAAMENGTTSEAYRMAATDVRYILSSLVQGEKMPDSSRLAAAVQGELVRHLGARYPEVEDLGVKRGPFYVLVGSHMPCILVETSFVNHPLEGRRLAEEAYRAALADGMARGLARFLAERPRAHTL